MHCPRAGGSWIFIRVNNNNFSILIQICATLEFWGFRRDVSVPCNLPWLRLGIEPRLQLIQASWSWFSDWVCGVTCCWILFTANLAVCQSHWNIAVVDAGMAIIPFLVTSLNNLIENVTTWLSSHADILAEFLAPLLSNMTFLLLEIIIEMVSFYLLNSPVILFESLIDLLGVNKARHLAESFMHHLSLGAGAPSRVLWEDWHYPRLSSVEGFDCSRMVSANVQHVLLLVLCFYLTDSKRIRTVCVGIVSKLFAISHNKVSGVKLVVIRNVDVPTCNSWETLLSVKLLRVKVLLLLGPWKVWVSSCNCPVGARRRGIVTSQVSWGLNSISQRSALGKWVTSYPPPCFCYFNALRPMEASP